ncbi:hypothetical protein D1007_22875 [Hordeum vulgare]|nr:hypothetical protein D1007_22875 [Hordeum vulgare]
MIKVWRDSWVPRGPSLRPIAAKGCCRVNKVSNFLKGNGSWDIVLLNTFFTRADVQVIRAIRTSPSQEEGFISWFPGKYGQFSVKPAYRLAMQEHVETHGNSACSARPEGDHPYWNLIWQARVPNKMRSFAWRVAVDALPTNECKSRHHIPVHVACRVCGAMEDSFFHALVICPKSMELWDLMRQDWPLPAKEKLVDTGKEWLFDILAHHNKEVRAMIIILLWWIWSLLNDMLHDKMVPPPEIS